KKSWLFVALSWLKSALPAKNDVRKSKKSCEFNASSAFQSHPHTGGPPASDSTNETSEPCGWKLPGLKNHWCADGSLKPCAAIPVDHRPPGGRGTLPPGAPSTITSSVRFSGVMSPTIRPPDPRGLSGRTTGITGHS